MGGWSEAEGVAFETGGGLRIRDALDEDVGVGDASAGLAAQGVPGGEHGFEQTEVEARVGEQGFDLGFEIGEHGIGDPAQALEADLGVGIGDEGAHPLGVSHVGAAQGDEGPDAVSGREGLDLRQSQTCAGEGGEGGVGEVGVFALGELEEFGGGELGFAGAEFAGEASFGVEGIGCGFEPGAGGAFVDLEFPQATALVDGVGAEDPVGEVESAVGSGGHADGAEEVAAADEGDAFRGVASAFALERVVVDAVITPTGDHNATAEFDHGAGALP